MPLSRRAFVRTVTVSAAVTAFGRLGSAEAAGVLPAPGGLYPSNAAPLHPTAFLRLTPGSGKVLAVAGMSTADSADVVQFSDDGTDDHLWQLV